MFLVNGILSCFLGLEFFGLLYCSPPCCFLTDGAVTNAEEESALRFYM